MKQTQPPGPPSIRDEKMPPVMPIPPAPAVTTQGHGRELSNLAKMYTEESKYSREDDNFDFKLTVFTTSVAEPTFLKKQRQRLSQQCYEV